jgi:hypothetical protein
LVQTREERKANLTRWAEDLTEEVFLEWKTKYSFWEQGFKVFYSPLLPAPELMIISLNPGRSHDIEKNFMNENYPVYKKGNFSIPLENQYVKSNGKIANKIKDLFQGYENILEKSVVITVLLFRSKNIREWKKENSKHTRLSMEDYAYDKVKTIITKIKPKKILVIGMSTFKRLKDKEIIPITNEEILDSFGTVGKIKIAKMNQTSIIVIPHLSGARIGKENKNKIKKSFKEFMDK